MPPQAASRSGGSISVVSSPNKVIVGSKNKTSSSSSFDAQKYEADIRAKQTKSTTVENKSKNENVVNKVFMNSPITMTNQNLIANYSNSNPNLNKGKVSSKPTTAWGKIKDQYDNSNWFNKLYMKVDWSLPFIGGILPAGVSWDLAKAGDNEIKTEDKLIRARTNEQLNKANTVEDWSKVSWFEDLPFIGDPLGLRSPEEKAYQNESQIVRETQILRNIGSDIPNTVVGFDEENNSSLNWTNYALIGAAAFLGIMVLKGK